MSAKSKTTVIQLGSVALAIQALPAKAAAVPAPTHHLLAIDISGSMYSDLPKLRTHLKNKLATLVQDHDTVSIIWFSGRGQVGALVEAMKIRGVSDLSVLHKAIDRFLVPTGLTGFKDPLLEIERIVDKLGSVGDGSLFNVMFLTDGGENQSPIKDVLAVCAKLERKLDSAAVVEYGYYADRALLTTMAETLGGKLVFNQDFEAYSTSIGSTLGSSTKKVPVKLARHIAHGAVFALAGSAVLTFTPDAAGVVLVPEGLSALAYFTSETGTVYDRKTHVDPLVWACLVPLAQRLDSNNIFSVLGALGDVALVNQFSSSFSKEDYSRFSEAVLAAAGDASKRYAEGYNPEAVPKEDAYTVLHLLSDLSSSEENLVYPYHPLWNYERIGAESQVKDGQAKFAVGDRAKGYAVNGLVWNEDRPNVSLRLRIDGKVTLPADRLAPLPEQVETFIYRAYTIIKDGIVHTRKLPVSLNHETFVKLRAQSLLEGQAWAPGKVFELTYPKLPVINRQMVKGATAKDTFAKVLELAQLKAAQKVFNDFRKAVAPKVSARLIALYGETATDYLASVGVTEFNGFNPSSETVKSGDFYVANELKIAVKGLSSLPKVSDVEAALAAGKKLKLSEHIMAPTLKRIADFKASPVFTGAADGDALLATWLESEAKAAVKRTRELMEQMARAKFAIVVGHVWFTDLPSIDVNSLDVEVPGYGAVPVTATLKSVEVAI